MPTEGTPTARVWTLESYFPVFNGPDMVAFKEKLQNDLDQLTAAAQQAPDLNPDAADDWEKIVLALEDAQTRLDHWSSYLSCLEAAHADEEAYSLERGEIDRTRAALKRIDVELVRAFKKAEAGCFEAFTRRRALLPIAYHLGRIRSRGRFTMSPSMERLAADLSLDGLQAWGRLYDRLSGKLGYKLRLDDGKTEVKPISQWRSLMAHPDRKIGRAAFEAGNRAWQGIEDVCAAALNAIAGSRLTLYRHRRRAHFLDEPLFKAGIQRQTLDAMYAAVRENIALPREFLKIKAAAMGRRQIAFFEREAPLPVAVAGPLSWSRAVELVDSSFAGVYPAPGVHFRRMLRGGWIESDARPNKRPGAFCTRSKLTGEQRVFMTFNGTLGDVTTLAHETGHAWHGHLLKTMRPWSQNYPMTLAETASIFAEHVLAEGLYRRVDVAEGQKLAMLDEDLSGMAVLLLDITTRFTFEQAFYEERQAGELSVSRFKELMGASQRKTYSDALAPDGEDPYFWASKLHFYINSLSFYNFPYTFGYLLARTLVARFREEGQAFLPRYEALLTASGSNTVETVVAQALDEDITRRAFWRDAIRGLTVDLGRYRKLLSAHA